MKARGVGLLPFVPAGADFEKAVAFFEAIGFEAVWRKNGYAALRFGAAHFILQAIENEVWQQNQMLILEVDGLDGYWAELEAKNLPQQFTGARIKPPTDFPWGREMHVIDTAGVCWHVRQEHAKS